MSELGHRRTAGPDTPAGGWSDEELVAWGFPPNGNRASAVVAGAVTADTRARSPALIRLLHLRIRFHFDQAVRWTLVMLGLAVLLLILLLMQLVALQTSAVVLVLVAGYIVTTGRIAWATRRDAQLEKVLTAPDLVIEPHADRCVLHAASTGAALELEPRVYDRLRNYLGDFQGKSLLPPRAD